MSERGQGGDRPDRDGARVAPGGPGSPARWTSSAKTGIGTALSSESRVWFTLSHGIFNEIYYPRIDQACVRDLGLIVSDGVDFFSEEKRDTESRVRWSEDGVPALQIVNACKEGRYRIEKGTVSDPARAAVIQSVRFVPLQGELSTYRLHVLLAPHLENQGADNSAWVGDFEGIPLLFAQRGKTALTLACSTGWLKRSVGYVGCSDGWQDLKAHKAMTWEYTRADDGNVALAGQVDLSSSGGAFVLALGFGGNPAEAAQTAIASLRGGFDKAWAEYVAGWRAWKKTATLVPQGAPRSRDLSQVSLAVLRAHESKEAPGGLIASLSIPWGFSKGDNDLGGYHLVWSRDMVETAGGLLAAGAHDDVRRVLSYLRTTQQPDGHWSQNMWLDGTPYWNGVQMDETALPILLVDLAHRHQALAETDLAPLWPMVRGAAGYLVRNGPVSPQDRWEEDPGYSPFTVAAQIAALLAAADLADLNQEAALGSYLREVADVWNASIDRWMYVSATDWCHRFDVKGYYVRIAPRASRGGGACFERGVRIENVTASEDTLAAIHLVSPDALALVRFGLRSANDPRMLDTTKVIDALLRIETPAGPTWHRYNGDGYGEHEDGTPFDGTGIGRGWPLLTGERAHYELAGGRLESAKSLLLAMESFANEGGLIPEQVWDSQDIAAHDLRVGRPSGSAMPLVWAHAEYLKLRRSLADGRLFDLPPQTVRRYLTGHTESPRVIWRFNHKLRSMPSNKMLRIETMAPAVVHWTADDWRTIADAPTHDTGLGLHVVDLEGQFSPGAKQVGFTFYWPAADRWECRDFSVRLEMIPRPQPSIG